MFKDTAVESLTLAIELFNRPSPLARDHAVIIMLAHSFEMLLKALIFQRNKTVRDTGSQLSHSLLRCIDLCKDREKVITGDDRVLLLAIKQDRDCAAHDTISMSDDLLWVHMRAGITLFRKLLHCEFNENLTDLLPNRVIPVSADPPQDLHTLVEQELEAISKLLAPGTRRTAEARARLRPLLSLDGSATGRSDQPNETEVRRAETSLRSGTDWPRIMPGLAKLSIAPAEPEGAAQEVVLRIEKGGSGVPVRRAARSEQDEALFYRAVSPFDEYAIKLSEFGSHLELSKTEGYALIEALRMKDDERAYFIRRTSAGNVRYQGLSARALELARKALADETFSLVEAVKRYNAQHTRKSARLFERCMAK